MENDSVEKLYQVKDEYNGSWCEIYAAPSAEGHRIEVDVPREVRESRALSKILLAKGVTTKAAENLHQLDCAIKSVVPVVYRAAVTGWHDGNARFVSHRHVAGEPNGKRVIPPTGKLLAGNDRLAIKGTLDGWKNVARLGRYSTTMTVALCVPFAAPLLGLLDRPNFTILLHGPSRAGKSSAQLLAASVLGIGHEEGLPSLLATKAGLLETAFGFRDCMLPINEIATADGSKRDIYDTLRNSTYSLMTGHDIIRHSSWPGALIGAPSTFRVIGLFSSEKSPNEWAARNGEARDAGEEARLIGVPVLFGGANSVFDRLPKKLSDREQDKWVAEQCARLRRQLPRQRGVAFQRYLDSLVQDVEAHRDRAIKIVQRFECRVPGSERSAVARDIAAKFGILYAGGVLAIRAGVLPLDVSTVRRAVSQACRVAIAELPNAEAEVQLDLDMLRHRLASGGVLNADSCTPKKLSSLLARADGFQQQQERGRRFVIRAKIFAEWFPSLLRQRQVLEALDERGFLLHVRQKGTGRSMEWAQTQVTWPNRTRVRSVSIFLPNNLADLNQTFESVLGPRSKYLNAQTL